MKNKNQGFTVVEMGVSFCLIFTIAILLFQVILAVKDVYIRSNIETTLLSKQGILLNRIYQDFENRAPTSISLSGNVFTFTFSDQTTSTLTIDQTNHKIVYDDYTWKLDENSKIGNYTYQLSETIDDHNYFYIHLDITNPLTDDMDYGFHLAYQLS